MIGVVNALGRLSTPDTPEAELLSGGQHDHEPGPPGVIALHQVLDPGPATVASDQGLHQVEAETFASYVSGAPVQPIEKLQRFLEDGGDIFGRGGPGVRHDAYVLGGPSGELRNVGPLDPRLRQCQADSELFL